MSLVDINNKSAVMDRLGELTSELIRITKEKAMVDKARLEEYTRMYLNSAESTVTGRERDARNAASSYEAISIELQGDLDALELEYRYLELVIEEG